MELRYLATFQTVERVGSFAKAADALSYAPSTITLHMQHLETELGFKLFVRQGKHIQLSTAGQALYEQVDVLLQQARTLEQTMKEIVAGETGSLRIGVIEPAASVCLMPLLAQFCREYPNMHVTLEVTSTRFICQRVAMGQLEIGLCSPPPAELGLTFEPLFFWTHRAAHSYGAPAGPDTAGDASSPVRRAPASHWPVLRVPGNH